MIHSSSDATFIIMKVIKKRKLLGKNHFSYVYLLFVKKSKGNEATIKLRIDRYEH